MMIRCSFFIYFASRAWIVTRYFTSYLTTLRVGTEFAVNSCMLPDLSGSFPLKYIMKCSRDIWDKSYFQGIAILLVKPLFVITLKIPFRKNDLLSNQMRIKIICSYCRCRCSILNTTNVETAAARCFRVWPLIKWPSTLKTSWSKYSSTFDSPYHETTQAI